MKTILLKLSGTLFANKEDGSSKAMVLNFIDQIKTLLQDGFSFGIVVGGGNFFRGSQQGTQLGIERATSDNVGMLATLMNSLILQDFFRQKDIQTKVLSALFIPQVALPLSQATINSSFSNHSCLIFAGGTGCPYMSTDTNAVIRALQIGTNEIWKATNVDYVYTDDPAKNKNSKPLPKVSYEEMLAKKLKIMDLTALTLAQEHQVKIRIFNIFTQQALLNVARNKDFGSTINS